MMVLLAHHIELHHVPVLSGIFVAGFWVGWQIVAKLLGRTSGTISSPPTPTA